MISKVQKSPAKRRKPKLISLSGACAHFRVKASGNPPSRGLLSYHLSTGALKPDKRTVLPTGGTVYGFRRKTLQRFARLQGWGYVA